MLAAIKGVCAGGASCASPLLSPMGWASFSNSITNSVDGGRVLLVIGDRWRRRLTKRADLGPLRALPTARHAPVERGDALALRRMRSFAWMAVVDAHHAALRSSSHSSMKAENWFQLRIVGDAGPEITNGLAAFP